MKKKLVYVVGGNHSYVNWLQPLGYKITNNKEEASLLFFTGGADIDPSAYGEKRGSYTSSDIYRDRREKEYFDYALQNGIKMFGTCAGHQRLGILGLKGSKMIQHIYHPPEHLTKFPYQNKEVRLLSGHHQSLLLKEEITRLREGKDYLLLAYTEKLSPFHLNGNDEDYKFDQDYKEVEAFFIPSINAMGFQTHLEWLDADDSSLKFCQGVFQEYLE